MSNLKDEEAFRPTRRSRQTSIKGQMEEVSVIGGPYVLVGEARKVVISSSSYYGALPRSRLIVEMGRRGLQCAMDKTDQELVELLVEDHELYGNGPYSLAGTSVFLRDPTSEEKLAAEDVEKELQGDVDRKALDHLKSVRAAAKKKPTTRKKAEIQLDTDEPEGAKEMIDLTNEDKKGLRRRAEHTIPMYRGIKDDAQSLNDFVDALETYFAHTDFGEKQKIEYASSFCDRRVLVWYRSACRRLGDPETFAQFVQRMEEKFISETACERALRLLRCMDLRDFYGNVDKYIDQFNEYCEAIPIGIYGELVRMQDFIHGLDDFMITHLLTPPRPVTLEEAQNKVSNYMKARSYKIRMGKPKMLRREGKPNEEKTVNSFAVTGAPTTKQSSEKPGRMIKCWFCDSTQHRCFGRLAQLECSDAKQHRKDYPTCTCEKCKLLNQKEQGLVSRRQKKAGNEKGL